MGMVFQSYALWPHMSVFENVAFGLTLKRTSRREIRERAERALAMVGLEGLAARTPAALSGGQQQRVALARSLVTEPAILLLDEPLSNLDAKLRERMRVELKDLQRRTGITFVYVTHDQAEAMALSDRIAVMNEGLLQQFAAPRAIYERPANRFIADFMGEANVVPCDIVSIEGGHATISIGGLHHRVAGRNMREGPAELAIRPSAITLAPKNGGAFSGEVTHAAYLGDHVEYEVKTSKGTLFVVDDSMERAFKPLTEVEIGFKDRGIAIIGG